MNFDKKQVDIILLEIRKEQSISPCIKDEVFINYIKEGMFDINESSGKMIDYDEDLQARSLLKNYVMYANYKRLAEFKELYAQDYASLQIKYY